MVVFVDLISSYKPNQMHTDVVSLSLAIEQDWTGGKWIDLEIVVHVSGV